MRILTIAFMILAISTMIKADEVSVSPTEKESDPGYVLPKVQQSIEDPATGLNLQPGQ